MKRKIIEAGNAVGFGGEPEKIPARLNPEPQPSAAVGESVWEELRAQWEKSI